MNRNQVKYEIKKIEERIQKNGFNDQVLMQTLKRNDQLYMNKEERIFRKKQEMEQIWEDQVKFLRKKVPRSKSEHLIETSNDYRYNKEKAQIIDLLKTDDEKYGNKYWYFSIRNNVNEDLKHSGIGNETIKAFNKSFINLKNNQLEFIRGSSQGNRKVGYTEKVLDLINMRKNARDEYLKKTINDNKRKMKFLKPVEAIQGFEVTEYFKEFYNRFKKVFIL